MKHIINYIILLIFCCHSIHAPQTTQQTITKAPTSSQTATQPPITATSPTTTNTPTPTATAMATPKTQAAATSSPTTTKIQTTTPTAFNNHNSIDIFATIALPLNKIKDPFTLNIFQQIDKIFGTEPNSLDIHQIQHLKKTYLYLIFLTKLDKITNNKAKTADDNNFLKYLSNANSQLPQLPTASLVTSSAWNNITITNQDIVQSRMWQFFCQSMVTDVYLFYFVMLQIIHNVEKQTFNYIPHIETSFYNADYTQLRTLDEITRTKLELKNNEKTYFVKQCTNWLSLKNTPIITTPAISTPPSTPANTATPSSAKITASTTTPHNSIEAAVVTFKQSSFYQTTHNLHTLTGSAAKQNLHTIQPSQLLAGPKLPSPLKEYVWGYFMLYEAQGQMTSNLNENNLLDCLTTWSNTQLPINIFPYTENDFALLSEIISAKSKAENNHTNSIHPSPKNFNVENIRPAAQLPCPHRSYPRFAAEQVTQNNKTAVQAQSWFSNIFHSIAHVASDIGHDVSTGFDDVKKGVEAAASTVSDIAKAAAQGAVGLGAIAVGDITFDSSISKWGTQEEQSAQTDLKDASTDLASSINDFTKGLEDGIVAPFAEVTGKLVGFVLDDQKIGQSMTTVINQVSDSLENIAAQAVISVGQVGLQAASVSLKRVQITEEFAKTIADAAVVVFTAGQVGQNAFLQDGKALMQDTITSITSNMSTLLSMGETDLSAVMTGLGAIINSLTTMFIDLSREVTYMVLSGDILTVAFGAMTGGLGGAVAGQLAGEYLLPQSQFAQQAENTVSNTLEAHRQTINQCMGVAIAVAADAAIIICTAGAGTGGAVAADTAIMGAAEGAAEIGAEVGTETAVEVGTEAAETVGETVAENTAEDVAEDTAEDVAEDTAEDAGKQVAKDTAEDAAKQTAKDTAKKLAEAAAKRSATIITKAISITLNVGFGLFNMIGGYNQDQKAILQENNQTQALKNLWKFTNENKLSTAKQESSFLAEIKAKQQAEIGNQMIGLALYQNQTNTNIDQLQQQIVSNLAPLYVQFLTPDSTSNLLPADIGSSWGIATNYLNLYPSQSFFTVSTGTPDFPFAQEVAQDPEQAMPSTTTTTTTKKQPSNNKLWFNQKAIALDNQNTNGTIKQPKDPLTVAADLQFIYLLNSTFHVGLYLGGNYHAYSSPQFLAQLLNTTTENISQTLTQLQTYTSKGQQIPTTLINASLIDLDAAHLAKMVVLYRKLATDPISLGIYEHEGAQWLLQQPLPPTFQLDTQHTYHLKATLDGAKLAIELSADSNPKTLIQKTVSVSAITNQRTYGIISSGAAICWNQLEPAPQIIPNGAVRPTTQAQTEIQREIQTKTSLALAMSPKFGTTTMKPISKQAILFGQYVYATVDTDLKKIIPASPGDFVIFASNNAGTISNIGQIPTTDRSAVILSLITGTIYDQNGHSVATINNAWTNYQTGHGPFSDKIDAYIKQQQSLIIKQLSNITFGSFALDIIDPTILASGQYIYKSLQTINAKDASGNPLVDYVIMAEISNNALGNLMGMTPTSVNAQGLLSLVTGSLYEKNTVFAKGTTPKPLIQYNAAAEFGSYANQYNINPNNQKTILTAQSAYGAYLTAQNQPKPTTILPIVKITPISSASANNISGIHIPLTGFHLGLTSTAPGIHLQMPGIGNLSNRQQQAAGTSGFQLTMPSKT